MKKKKEETMVLKKKKESKRRIGRKIMEEEKKSNTLIKCNDLKKKALPVNKHQSPFNAFSGKKNPKN